MSWFSFSWQNFWFSFLALLFEGLPFLLVGSLVSGCVAVFVSSHRLTRLLPKNPLLAVPASGFLGIFLPVCDCGIMPVVRRLLNKGMPLSCGLTFMLASPIVNPIVAFSTYAAFRGQAPGLNTLIRLGFGYAVAVLVGFASLALRPGAVVRGEILRSNPRRRAGLSIAAVPVDSPDDQAPTFGARTGAVVRLASDDFIDTAIYFVVGAAAAATFNTAVNQEIILPLARHALLATGAMTGLSALMTLCSTSDAFIAATFISFPLFARMSFLIFGPMFDFKLIFLYGVLFRKRFIALLGVGLFIVVTLLCSQILPVIYASRGI